MAKDRTELQTLLEGILGSRQVYFRAPENVKMKYPAIVYTRSDLNAVYADDAMYLLHKKYTVTLIYRDPDSDLPEKILALPLCSFDRHYVAENLNHDVFTIYF